MSETPSNPVFVEIVFLRLKCDVVPEEPSTNLGGQQFLDLMGDIAQQNGYLRSAWGRSMENPARVVIMVEWADESCAIPFTRLDPFVDEHDHEDIEDNESRLITVYATMTPAPLTSGAVGKSPVVEITVLATPSVIGVELSRANVQTQSWQRDLMEFQQMLLHGLPEGKDDEKEKGGTGEKSLRALALCVGRIERPSSFGYTSDVVTVPKDGGGGADGRADGDRETYADTYLLVIGWRSREHHMQAKETPQYKRIIEPLRQRMMAEPCKGLQSCHVAFTLVEQSPLNKVPYDCK